MISEYFAFVSAALIIGGNSVYAVASYKGKIEPNLVTWTLWGIAPIITFFAQMSEGESMLRSALALVSGLTPFAIVAAALIESNFKYKFQKMDIICAAASIIAIVLWIITGKGSLAIAFSIVAGLAAGLPTALKAWRNPKSEMTVPFVCGVFAAAITLLTLQSYDFESLGFPLYLIISNGILWWLTARKHGAQSNQQA